MATSAPNPRTSSAAKKAGATTPQDTIDWRIKELRAFDASHISDRWDPRLESLKKGINDALAEVLGNNTPDYKKFELEAFDATLPSDFGGRYSADELQQAVKEGLEKAILNLKRVKVLLAERARQQQAAPAPALFTARSLIE